MTQYLHYNFAQNSKSILNQGAGGSAYNGQAVRAQFQKNSLGNPMWGPLTANTDGINVPGINSPYNHTWQAGLNINQWWPGAGCEGGIQDGNDGKLWSAGNDLYYGYLHGVSDGCLSGVASTYNFTVEIAYNESPSYNDNSVQFWLGVGSAKPVSIPLAGCADEGRIYWVFDYNLQLNTNYYFQVSVNLPDASQWASAGNYAIGNCIESGAPCADAAVTGFPCGAYLYSWREDDTVLDLSAGGNWADDVVLWAGGSPTPTPTPPAPVAADGSNGAQALWHWTTCEIYDKRY
ncbi:MAG: hypothetical protein ABSC64_02425 [Candidatus Korobacteraceae bacterium]|jgi:hypothetical protein